MNLRVIKDKVLLDVMPRPTKSGGGIFLAEDWQPPSDEAIVVAVGPLCEHVKVGDRVGYKWFETEQAGTDVKWDGKTYKTLREAQLSVIVEQTV